MKNLLYIGNKLTNSGLNATTIDTLSNQLRSEGFVVQTRSSAKNKIIRLSGMLWGVIQNRKVDVVLIDTYSTSAFWYAFLTSQLCRLLKIKYIPILHGGNLPSRIKKNPKITQWVFKNAYRNVAPSDYLKIELEQVGYHNVIHIPNTIELQKYPFKKREEVKPKLLWVRAFAKIYNPKMAIEVLYKIKQKYPLAELCMVGPDKDGSLEETKKFADSLKLKVTFTGGLTKKEWITLSQQYDIFINTTHFDNTPVSVIEALALGMPVISTRVGGIPYLLKDGEEALLVGDNEAQNMADKIEGLLQNPNQVAKLTHTARQKAKSFDWQQIKNQWKALLTNNEQQTTNNR